MEEDELGVRQLWGVADQAHRADDGGALSSNTLGDDTGRRCTEKPMSQRAARTESLTMTFTSQLSPHAGKRRIGTWVPRAMHDGMGTSTRLTSQAPERVSNCSRRG